MTRNGVGEEDDYYDDGEYIAANSVTYEEKVCRRNNKLGSPFSCDFGACVPSSYAIGRRLQADTHQSASKNTSSTSSGGNRRFQCRMSASYAEGSTWSAIEASDVIHPFGPTAKNDANTIDFRLKFGCQTKVSYNFDKICSMHMTSKSYHRTDLQMYAYRSPAYLNISSRMA